jgi:hypothetical protein
MPEDPSTAFDKKHLTINTDSYAAMYCHHDVAMRAGSSLSVYTATEASAIGLFPSAHPFADFARTPVCEYTRCDAEETDAEMRDSLVNSPFIQVESTSQSTSPGQATVLRGRLALSEACDSKATDDSGL